MIAYNRTWLDSLLIRAASRKARKQKLLEEEEWIKIRDTNAIGFYTPNFFIRCGLFLLTLVITLFTFGLICLVFIDGIESSIEVISIFFGLFTYAALELMVQQKHHLRSGVTEALIWTSAGTLFAGFSNLLHLGDLANCILLYLISAWLSIRFADIVASLVAFLSFLASLFYGSVLFSELTKSLAPFLIMAASCVTYVCMKQVDFRQRFRHYVQCMDTVEFCSLISLYAAGNYFIIDQVNTNLLTHEFAPVTHIPFGFLFWISTCTVPPAYIAVGLIKKDRMLYRAGLLLLVALVFTIKYYFSIAPLEVTFVVAGIILIAVAWVLIRSLKQAKYGYTYTKDEERHIALTHIETVVIAETFTENAGEEGNTKFGGGNFGGAGAGGEF